MASKNASSRTNTAENTEGDVVQNGDKVNRDKIRGNKTKILFQFKNCSINTPIISNSSGTSSEMKELLRRQIENGQKGINNLGMTQPKEFPMTEELERGKSLVEQGKMDEAITILKSPADPHQGNNAVAQYLMGYIHSRSGKIQSLLIPKRHKNMPYGPPAKETAMVSTISPDSCMMTETQKVLST